ncbi:DUF2812 domain-containing protein [Bacillus inaquosorum]|uniref:DUF2812 domain-containing protein n=1 Tax=Bacillus inaquosorum TaxID=483913 RepID=UPI00228220D3|nr:DUF2812 domain-containing protein [Bacillus inaquosorum]MCY7961628.1 DUF2812 domain-containing protein [Bacillus inaquosorum]MCY8870240.1 DUF2812 domain-containing protein [Bacillus inaquosorum]
MKQNKYMMSEGLAFSEEKDMKRLSDMASKGWLLDSFAFMGYKLKKAEPRKLIYSIDYHDVESLEEYTEMFEAAGWEHVCSSHGMHIFSAEPGTSPIYSDQSTMREKYKRSEKAVRNVACTLSFLTLLSITLHYVTGLSNWVPLAFLIVTFPFLVTYAAAKSRTLGKWGKSV